MIVTIFGIEQLKALGDPAFFASALECGTSDGKTVRFDMAKKCSALLVPQIPKPKKTKKPTKEKKPRPEVAEGPKLWAELHTRGIQEKIDPAAELKWLEDFFRRVPCGECRTFSRKYTKEHPPDFENYFAWGVGFHNAANAKLGKPQVPLDEAIKLWKK
jgi:hypothetical protein